MARARLMSVGVCALVASALFGCSALDTSQDRENADMSARRLIDAIAQDDAGLANESLSREVVGKCDIEASIHAAHRALGSPISSVQPGPKSEGREYYHGRMARSLTAYYDVMTSDDEYVLYIEFYPFNSIDSDKEGINKAFFGTKEDFLASAQGDEELIWNFGEASMKRLRRH